MGKQQNQGLVKFFALKMNKAVYRQLLWFSEKVNLSKMILRYIIPLLEMTLNIHHPSDLRAMPPQLPKPSHSQRASAF